LTWLIEHPVWGIIALPILSKLYLRQVDLDKRIGKYPLEFHTKIELGIQLLERFVRPIRWLNPAATFGTDSTMDAKAILETYLSRWSIEECFHDLKEV
jgi:hypothetical protein